MLTQLSPTPLGRGLGFAVRNDNDKAAVIRAMSQVMGRDPLLLARRHERYSAAEHLQRLRRPNHYMACLRAGRPCFLFLMRVQETAAGVCVLVEQNVSKGFFYPRMSLVHLSFSDELFEGTVFDAEQVAHDPGATATLVLGDVLAIGGRSMLQAALPNRLDVLRQVHSQRFLPTDMDPFHVHVKHMFAPKSLQTVVSSLATLGYAINGVVFKPTGGCAAGLPIVFSLRTIKVAAGARPGDDQTDSGGQQELMDASNGDVFPRPRALPQDADHESASQHAAEALFHVRRTGLPDVYELFATQDEMDRVPVGAGNLRAGVPTMSASRSLHEELHRRESSRMRFSYNQRLACWVPVQQASLVDGPEAPAGSEKHGEPCKQ
jgi:hypothetical protein